MTTETEQAARRLANSFVACGCADGRHIPSCDRLTAILVEHAQERARLEAERDQWFDEGTKLSGERDTQRERATNAEAERDAARAALAAARAHLNQQPPACEKCRRMAALETDNRELREALATLRLPAETPQGEGGR